MRFEMKMPDLATTDSAIRVVRWIIEPGQKVQRGQPLLEVETDKATMEVESVVSGRLAEVQAQVGDEVIVGQMVAVLETEEAGRPAATSACGPAGARPAPAQKVATPAPGAVPPRRGGAGGMFARNRAAAATSTPSAAKAPAVTSRSLPLSVAQRTAAKRLQESKQTIPHFYLQARFNAEKIVARRKAAGKDAPAWDAFFVLAVAKAIAHFERFRGRFEGEHLALADHDAIGVAIDHDGELYVLPVSEPAKKTVEQISAEIRKNVERLRGGDPEMRMIRPALMTVTNLGVCNVESFIPIINPPEAAILGIGKVAREPVVREDGTVGVGQRCTLTLCVDHRIASGRYAGDFLGAIVEELEAF